MVKGSQYRLVLIFWLLPLMLFSQATQDQLKAIRSTVTEKVDGREFYIHTIKRGQTLYMISKAYGVEVNDIIAENPQVKNGIKADEKIRIAIPARGGEPAKKTTLQKPSNTSGTGQTSATAAEKAKPAADSIAAREMPCGTDISVRTRVYNVALMLPLYLQDVGLINTDPRVPDPEEPYRSFQFIQFYEGFRMAVDSLVKTGLNIRLWVYDVEKDTAKTRQLLKDPVLKTMDLIVGLLYTRNFQIVADFAEKNKISIVNPISERSDVVTGNATVFKVRPSKKSRMDNLASYMASAFYRGQILILRGGQFPDRELPEHLKKECLERQLNVILADNQEGLITRLSKEKENYVVLFSDNQAYILDFTRRLFELRNDYNLTLVGLPDWSSMEGLDMEYLVNLRTHMMAPWFIDYEVPRVRKFVHAYTSVYKTDPDPLAFQGYDVGLYFLSALMNYGPDLRRCIPDFKMKILQTTFDFGRTSKNNGFENRYWPVFKYENYKLVGVN